MRGELRFLPYVFPCPTLQKGLTLSLHGKDGQERELKVESVRLHPPVVLVRFHTITTLDQAQALRNAVVSVEEHFLPPLQDGEFYYYQVVGLSVFTVTGEEIGTVAHVFFSGGHDVWVVQRGKKEYMIPVTEEVVRSLDIPNGRVIIEPMAGLLE
jgi:16S rRNA processing protein RimM